MYVNEKPPGPYHPWALLTSSSAKALPSLGPTIPGPYHPWALPSLGPAIPGPYSHKFISLK